jgi:hypothetical protein
MTSLLAGIFSENSFTPHGFCLAWEPMLLWLHIISDSIVAFPITPSRLRSSTSFRGAGTSRFAAFLC